MNKLLALAILLVALAGCVSGGDSKNYPPEVRANFMKSCVGSAGAGGEKVCSCAFDEIKKKYTLQEFTALEEEIRKGSTPAGLISIIGSCVQS